MAKRKGYWLVTPPTGDSKRFYSTKDMVAFVQKRNGCLISWQTTDS